MKKRKLGKPCFPTLTSLDIYVFSVLQADLVVGWIGVLELAGAAELHPGLAAYGLGDALDAAVLQLFVLAA